MCDAKRYLKEISAHPDKLEKFSDMMCDVFHVLKTVSPSVYTKALIDMHVLAYGKHFDDCLAEEAVRSMHNVDGTTGGHWTRHETDVHADIVGEKHKADFYYLMNMLGSDYQNVLGNNDDVYRNLAKATIDDPDAPEGKWLMMYMWSR